MNIKTTLSKWSWIRPNEHPAARMGMLVLLLLLALPAVVQAQFNYTTNNGTITITGYTGPGGAVTIPGMINGLPVTSIGDGAFYNGGPLQPYTLTSVTIPNSVTNIGSWAFAWCMSLSSVTLGTGLTSIGTGALADCGFITITIPSRVTSIGDLAFANCWSLTGVFFQGNAPSLGGPSVFSGDNNYVYYLSGKTGWGPTFGGRPTARWNQQVPWIYSTNNSTITIISYIGPGGVVTIPSTINGWQVTSLGDYAFWNCTTLTSVIIPNSVTSIGEEAFSSCTSLASVTIGSGVTSIAAWTFDNCTSLTSVTIPNNITSIGYEAFYSCTSLTNVMIPNSVTSIGNYAFLHCTSLTAITVDPLNSVYSSADGVLYNKSQTTLIQCPEGKAGSYTIPASVTSIGFMAFYSCTHLTSVTIPNSVTSIGDQAFYWCTSLTGVFFKGNAPSLGGSLVFFANNNATAYYLPGTTGWGPTFGGLPTVLWIPPTIQMSPQTQTAEAGSAVCLWAHATNSLPLFYLWYFNGTNLLSCSTNCELELTNVLFSQSGAYTVVISNVLGAVTSAPAMLQVIPSVERRPVPGINVMGDAGSLLNVDYADSLSPAPNWTTLGSISLTSTSQYCFDLTMPLPPQRFYRAWQTGTPGVIPSLDLHMVPAITLTGNINDSWHLDYINAIGPTDAWVTLDTVTLTNTSQLYFDVSAVGQPQRLYRLVQVP